MIPKELLKKIRHIEITTSRKVTDLFAGQYHSAFKGQGIEFEEVREYQPGDDIRAIDWNVTARTGKAHIKKFVEERELTVMIVVDVSMSCRFGTVNQMKSDLAAEITAVVAFSAIRNNDRVGLIVFSDEVELFVPPRKGVSHVLRVIREILYFKPKKQGTNIEQALAFLNRVTKHKAVTFLLSDFLDTSKGHSETGQFPFTHALQVANRRHDLIAVALNDPREFELPDCGLIEVEDAENGGMTLVDSSNPDIRMRFNKISSERQAARNLFFGRLGVDHINVSTDKPFDKELIKFFKRRKRRLV